MSKLVRFLAAGIVFSSIPLSQYAFAANDPGIKIVDKDDLVEIDVSGTSTSGAPYQKTIFCYKGTPGSKVKKTKSGEFLVKLTTKAAQTAFKKAKQKKKLYSNDKKSKDYKKAKKQYDKAKGNLDVAKALQSEATEACNVPSYLSLAQYNGIFGEVQVRRLLEVFALGGKEELVQKYVGMGLSAAVKDLMTVKPDPYAQSILEKLWCDPNPDDELLECYENGNPNDIYIDGIISGLNIEMVATENGMRAALEQFVLDERGPGDPRVLNGNNRWMFRPYLELIRRFGNSGDYLQYVVDSTNSDFVHGKWLHGDSNHAGIGIHQEDFGREVMELFTLGTKDPNGKPTYTDLDVATVSQLCSGMDEVTNEDLNGNDIAAIGWFKDLHKEGPFNVFPGTSYQMTVPENSMSTAEGFVRMLFDVRKDQIAYELARRLWPRFISSKATLVSINNLANLIIKNDFKLWPVMEVMAKSKAFYAPESAETIMKNPHTLLVTYMRMLGMPVDDYNWMRSWFRDIGMLLGRPPTVFGFSYQNKLLASDVYQLERFNSIFSYTMWQDMEDIKTKYGWTIYGNLIATIPLSGYPEKDVVNALLKRFNLAHSVTPSQVQAYEMFIANYMADCNNNNDQTCFMYNGELKKLYRDVPDLGDPEGDFYRVLLLAVMMGTNRDFQTM